MSRICPQISTTLNIPLPDSMKITCIEEFLAQSVRLWPSTPRKNEASTCPQTDLESIMEVSVVLSMKAVESRIGGVYMAPVSEHELNHVPCTFQTRIGGHDLVHAGPPQGSILHNLASLQTRLSFGKPEQTMPVASIRAIS